MPCSDLGSDVASDVGRVSVRADGGRVGERYGLIGGQFARWHRTSGILLQRIGCFDSVLRF